MGERGPVPKRESQRRRRNKPERPVTHAATNVDVKIPEPHHEWHPMATGFYEALRSSGQSQFYTAADWHAAHLCASLMSRVYSDPEAGASVVREIRGLFSQLLVTEGDRRRVSVELERGASSDADDQVVSELDAYRRRSGSAAG